METGEPKADYEPAKIFNEHQRDLGQRLATFTNHLIILDAGILSITIGAFLGITPPTFAPDALAILRVAWWALSIGLICALTSAFLVLIAQVLVQDKMRAIYSADGTRELQLITGPTWMRHLIRVLMVAGFGSTVIGVAAMSWAASAMLRIA